MTKDELIIEIADKSGISKTNVRQIVEGLMQTMKNSIADSDTIYLRGFGTFGIKEQKAKVGRNIAQNTSIEIPARKTIFFKPSDTFKDMIE